MIRLFMEVSFSRGDVGGGADRSVRAVDDGTAVIECVCELPKQQEFSHASLLKKKSLETDDATKKSSTKVESASVNQRPMLDVGTLVRVVGRITEPWNPDWDRTIRVEGIRESVFARVDTRGAS